MKWTNIGSDKTKYTFFDKPGNPLNFSWHFLADLRLT